MDHQISGTPGTSRLVRSHLIGPYLLLILAGCFLAASPAQGQRQPRLRGDVNGDGAVTAADALLLVQHLAGLPLSAGVQLLPAGDADADGRITAADARLITAFAAGTELPGSLVGTPLREDTPSPGVLTCSVEVARRAVSCGAGDLPAAEGPRLAILGGQGTYVRLISSNVGYDSVATIFSAGFAVQNLIPQPLGTSDGTTLSPGGIRLFLHLAPTPTVGVGAIEVENADGTGTFTAAAQPYFQYDEVLPSGATSTPKEWRLLVPRTVQNFAFQIYVSAAVPHELGWLELAPASPVVVVAATEQLVATSRSLVGREEPLGTVSWSSSDTTVARVSETGLVTAVAPGQARVTAMSGPRTGSTTVVVARYSVGAARDTIAAGDTVSVVAQLEDASGDPVASEGHTLVWSLPAGSGSLSADTTVTDETGSSRVLLTVDTVAGTRLGVAVEVPGGPLVLTDTIVVVAAAPDTMLLVVGDAQTGTVGDALPVSPQVRLLDPWGNPVPGVEVTFTPEDGEVESAQVTSDSAGFASPGAWTLRTTPGTSTLTASTAGAADLVFTATALPGPAAEIVPHAGNSQRVDVGSTLPTAPSVRAVDRFGNGVPGVTVSFAVDSGGGSITGAVQTTDSVGVAAVGSWTTGPGVGRNVLAVTSAGLPDGRLHAIALVDYFSTDFADGTGGWWTYQWPVHPDSLPPSYAWCQGWPTAGSTSQVCQSRLRWDPAGFVESRAPWWPDGNHVASGMGVLHLVAIQWINHHWEGFNVRTLDLTNAQLQLRLRGDSLNLQGGRLYLWIQTQDTVAGKTVNYAYTKVALDTLLAPGVWTDVTVDLDPVEADWSCLGGILKYGCSDSIARVLRDTNIDFGLILIPVPYPEPAVKGVFRFDSVRLRLGAPQPPP